jgi:hypothetical protein
LRHKHATGCEIFLQAITAAVYFNWTMCCMSNSLWHISFKTNKLNVQSTFTLNNRLSTAYLDLIKKIASHMIINNVLQLHMHFMFSSIWISNILAWHDWPLNLCLQVSKQQANQTEGNKQHLKHEMWIYNFPIHKFHYSMTKRMELATGKGSWIMTHHYSNISSF